MGCVSTRLIRQLKRSVTLEASPADEAASQRDEGVVEFGSAFPADGEALELVEQGEGLLDDVAEFAQALDVRGAFAGDDRQDPLLAQLTPVTAGPPPAAAREPSPAREAAAARSASARRHPRSTPSTHTHPNGRIVTSVTPDQGTSTRSCYELLWSTGVVTRTSTDEGLSQHSRSSHWRATCGESRMGRSG